MASADTSESLGFDDWLRERLEAAGADATVYGPYVRSVLEDEDGGDFSERMETAHDLLEGFIDDAAELDALMAEVQPRWEREQSSQEERAAAAEQARQTKIRADEERRRATALREAEKARLKHEREQAEREKNIDPKEKAQRDALLARYAYHVEEVDEEGNLLLTETMDGEELGSAAGLAMFRNDNAEREREAEKLKREQHAIKVREERVRNKQQQERERLRRETVKPTTQKKEKRRM